MKIFTEPVVILDTETTGFHQTAELIEIGAVCIDEWGRERTSFSALIRPQILDDWRVEKALTVSKISKQALLKAESLENIRMLFMNWMESLPTTSPKCVAFNTNFDKRMLDRAGIHLSWGYCLLKMTKELMTQRGFVIRGPNGKAKAPSLEDACNYFGVEYPENAHRALEDARISSVIATKVFPLWREIQSA